MAQIWINSKTNQCEIKGELNDPELAQVAIKVGYHNTFRRGLFEVIDEIKTDVPEGFMVTYGDRDEETTPTGAVRIGQVRVHSGDSSFPLFLMRSPKSI